MWLLSRPRIFLRARSIRSHRTGEDAELPAPRFSEEDGAEPLPADVLLGCCWGALRERCSAPRGV